MTWPHHRYALVLLALYGILFVALAFNPNDRPTWLMENGLALIFVIGLFCTRNILPLSRISYTLIFLFTILHTVGAYYTYQEVPYDEWSRAIFGSSVSDWFGWDRNHYDRLVHFLYGLLIAYPIRELFLRVAAVRGFWGYFLPLDLTMSTSMLYELLEWVVAVILGEGSSGYVGAQGDEWDAHKDMALATLGAIVAMAITAAINYRMQRDFARELAESLRVKRVAPLGEDELIRLSSSQK
jgi:putative membrane protein